MAEEPDSIFSERGDEEGFTPESLGDFIRTTAEQHANYLELYQSFLPHMTLDLIKDEIERLKVTKVPAGLASSITALLQQQLTTRQDSKGEVMPETKSQV